MKRLPWFFSFILSLTLSAFTQARPGGNGGGGNTGGNTGGNQPSMPSIPNNPNIGTRTPSIPEIERPTFISGKVVLSDGSKITEPAAIQSTCSSRRRIEAYTDSQGNFSFELKKKSSNMTTQTADMSNNEDMFTRANSSLEWRDCELQAVLAGFTSDSVPLAHSLPFSSNTDVGRITLRAIGNAQGAALSATSMAAPDNARKAMDKALEQERKNKLPDAQKSLEKAIGIYPQYAAAWTELGRIQYMGHDDTGARQSFEKALAADSKYAKPYLGLAQLSVDAQQWQSVVDITDKLLAMNSVDFPSAWFLNAAAYYNMRNLDAAEKSALNGIKIDPDHHYPRIEHLMGVILIGKRDYPQAAEHLRTFMRLSTQPNEVAEAQKQLQQAEQLSAGANLAPAPKQQN